MQVDRRNSRPFEGAPLSASWDPYEVWYTRVRAVAQPVRLQRRAIRTIAWSALFLVMFRLISGKRRSTISPESR